MSPRVATIFTNFLSGEFSPKLDGRVDLPNYFNSCRILENMLVSVQGYAEFRPGTYYVSEIKDSSVSSRLIPFELASGNYMLEFGYTGTNLYIRFYKNGARIENPPGTPVEVTISADDSTQSDIWQVKYAQTKDTIYFFHSNFSPKKLTRTDDYNWTFENVTFTGTGVPDFTTVNNRPSCATFFEQRMWLAGTNNYPEKVWASKVGEIEDFNSADRLEYVIYHNKRLHIKWMIPKNKIIWGALNCEGTLYGSTSLVNISVESEIGSSDIQGVKLGDISVFIQKGGRKLRGLVYSDEAQSWYSLDLNINSDHIIETGVNQIAVQTNPDTILWVTRADGVLSGFTFEREYKVAAWHRHITDGEYESVAVIPGSEEDEVWVIVKRIINGSIKRYVEYFKPRNFGTDQKDCFFVDCGKTYDYGSEKTITGATKTNPVVVTSINHGLSADSIVKIRNVIGMTEINTTNNGYYMIKNPTTDTFELYSEDGNSTIDGTSWGTYTSGGTVLKVVKSLSGLSHLEGKTVNILTDGAAHPQKTVSSGIVNLNIYANKIHVGLPYKGKIKPMRVEAGAVDVAQGRTKRIHKVIARFYKTLGCKVGQDEDKLEIIPFRLGTELMDQPPSLYTGDRELAFPGGYDENGDIIFVQDQPLPMNLLAIILHLTTYD